MERLQLQSQTGVIHRQLSSSVVSVYEWAETGFHITPDGRAWWDDRPPHRSERIPFRERSTL